MKTDYSTNWTKEEFKAYILLYCCQADFSESQQEKDLIISKVGKNNYLHIHSEIDSDNDFTRIQKISNTAKRMDYSKEKLVEDMKQVFFADGSFDILEQNLLLSLKRIL